MTDDRFDDWLDGHRGEPLSPPPGAYERIARRAGRRRAARVAGVAAAVVVLLAGVSGLAYRIAGGARPSPVPAASAPADLRSPAPSSPGPAPSGTSAAPAAPSPAISSPPPVTRCHTGDLRVTIGDAPGGGAAGSQYSLLLVRNVAGRACTLSGYPGVSWVTGPSGQQVNDPFHRTGAGPARLTLAPGGVANAQLRSGNPDMYGEQCRPVPVAGLRVYPPDETSAVFVAHSAQVCSAEGVGVGEVWPLVAGATR